MTWEVHSPDRIHTEIDTPFEVATLVRKVLPVGGRLVAVAPDQTQCVIQRVLDGFVIVASNNNHPYVRQLRSAFVRPESEDSR